MLDSADYNTATVNITKSVKILAVPGVAGTWGIRMTAGGSLAVEGSPLAGLPDGGILAAGPMAVKMADTTITMPVSNSTLEGSYAGAWP